MTSELRPRRVWYLLVVLLLVAGGIPSALLLVDGIGGIRAPLIRMIAPGTDVITFPKGGTWTVFYEFRGTVDGRTFNTPRDLPHLLPVLTSGSGEDLVASPITGSISYDLPHAQGYSIASFELDGPGTYTVAVIDEFQSTEHVLAFGREKGAAVGRIVGGAVLGGLTLFLVLVAFGLILFLRVRSKRRIEKQSFAAGLPPPPGY